MTTQWLKRQDALTYLKENGKPMTGDGLYYHIQQGNLTVETGKEPDAHPRQTYIAKHELDTLIAEGRKRGEMPDSFGEDIITPPMFYKEGYALRVARNQVAVTLDGRNVTDVYPESDTSRWYIAVYEDGSSARIWNRKSLHVKHLDTN